jgi:hypothetical protein
MASSPAAAPLSGELFPPLGRQQEDDPTAAEKRRSSFGAGPTPRAEGAERPKDAATALAPSLVAVPAAAAPAPPSVFQTPPPEEADTEEERERRRRALALEQQRLILEQVEAARRASAAKKAVPGHTSSSHQPVVRHLRRGVTKCVFAVAART